VRRARARAPAAARARAPEPWPPRGPDPHAAPLTPPPNPTRPRPRNRPREETLRTHFSQFGAVEAIEILRDRVSGKSRGFGFVTFADAVSAAHALAAEHVIDGRRCEAKVALPRTMLSDAASGASGTPPPAPAAAAPAPAASAAAAAVAAAAAAAAAGPLGGFGPLAGAPPLAGPPPPCSTRIFVARIPAAVSEAQFRAYFEQFGRLQDAYMPKDHSKQAYRGIGFVTFSSPEAVERVLSTKHWCGGRAGGLPFLPAPRPPRCKPSCSVPWPGC
jgi:hypothetical protein